MSKILVNEEKGLKLAEACDLLWGQIPINTLSPSKLACIEGNISNTDELVELVLEKGQRYDMTGLEPLVLSRKITVIGNGACIHGGVEGFSVVGSDITIENVNFDHIATAIVVTNIGLPVENIRITGCNFSNLGKMGVIVGSAVVGGAIKHVRIDHNDYRGYDSGQLDDGYLGGRVFILVGAGFIDQAIDLDDCLLEDLVIDHNHAHGNHRLSLQFIGAAAVPNASEEGMNSEAANRVHNNTIRGVKILDNLFEDCWDASVNMTIGSFINENSQLHDVEIANNKFLSGYWAVFISCLEPIIGRNVSGSLSNFNIHDNDIKAKDCMPGTNTVGVGIEAGRLDYYENVYCSNGIIEKVKIVNNRFINLTRPIFINAADNMFDCPNTAITNCVCRDILVESNEINECAEPFSIIAGWNEGKRYDWQSGIPPVNTKWGYPIQDHDIECTAIENNRVENVVICRNTINGYRYKYIISGTHAMGHGSIKNNTCEVSMFDNTFTNGEGHAMVKPAIFFDYTKDHGGNSVKLTVEGEVIE